MTHEGISFEIRAGLGRNEWTLLIAYPDRADSFVTQANGSRDDAIAAAYRRIGAWIRRQRNKALVNSSQEAK
jgi:hypothetical protein